MNNFVHPDFNHVTLRDGKKNIEIEQIREIIKYTHKSSFNNKKRFILIDNAELMSLNATNSLLKIVEEPTDNLHFIINFAIFSLSTYLICNFVIALFWLEFDYLLIS